MSETDKKYQWSRFSPDRSEQIVLRTDNFEEFKEDILRLKGLLPQTAAFPDDDGGAVATPVSRVQEAVGLCPVHKTPFVNGKFGMFCNKKNDDGSWCKQKPKR